MAELQENMDVADYRRQMARLYTAVRDRADPREAWESWRASRQELFRHHPASPWSARPDRATFDIPVFSYDPTWRLTATVAPAAAGEPMAIAHSGAGATSARPLGTVRISRGDQVGELTVYWLEQYGGGLFLPFADATSGTETYGGGRYLLDGAKSADLGGTGDALVLDFNFAYHPSCVHDHRWSCPLAPPGNRLPCAVRAGERLP